MAHSKADRLIMDPLPYHDDQIIDAAMARSLHADACRDHALVAWVALWDLPAYPKKYAARLAGDKRPGPLPLYQPAERRLHLLQGKPLILATSSQSGWVILFASWYYLLLADTLAGVQELLPPGLVRSERMPADPPEVVEIWFAG